MLKGPLLINRYHGELPLLGAGWVPVLRGEELLSERCLQSWRAEFSTEQTLHMKARLHQLSLGLHLFCGFGLLPLQMGSWSLYWAAAVSLPFQPLLPPPLQYFLQLFWTPICFSFSLPRYPVVLLKQHISCRIKPEDMKGFGFFCHSHLLADLCCLKGQMISSKQMCSQ